MSFFLSYSGNNPQVLTGTIIILVFALCAIVLAVFTSQNIKEKNAAKNARLERFRKIFPRLPLFVVSRKAPDSNEPSELEVHFINALINNHGSVSELSEDSRGVFLESGTVPRVLTDTTLAIFKNYGLCIIVQYPKTFTIQILVPEAVSRNGQVMVAFFGSFRFQNPANIDWHFVLNSIAYAIESQSES